MKCKKLTNKFYFLANCLQESNRLICNAGSLMFDHAIRIVIGTNICNLLLLYMRYHLLTNISQASVTLVTFNYHEINDIYSSWVG
jgi:hypothetical protein